MPNRFRIARGQTRTALLPRFDLTIILDAPAEIIHRRKPELPLDELKRQRTALRRLAAGNRRSVIVSTADRPDEVARAVCRHVIRFLAEREQRRFGKAI